MTFKLDLYVEIVTVLEKGPKPFSKTYNVY